MTQWCKSTLEERFKTASIELLDGTTKLKFFNVKVDGEVRINHQEGSDGENNGRRTRSFRRVPSGVSLCGGAVCVCIRVRVRGVRTRGSVCCRERGPNPNWLNYPRYTGCVC